MSFRDYESKPILHRKELMLSPNHPDFERFSQLTGDEEAEGLLGHNFIGTERGWNDFLADRGFSVTAEGNLIKKS